MTLTPDPIERAVVDIEGYLAGKVKLAACAASILAIPNCHALRWEEVGGVMADTVYDTAATLKGATPEALQLFCVRLREGRAAMLAGWWGTLHGPYAEDV